MNKKVKEENKCKSSVIFSVKDKLNSDKDYYGKIYGGKKHKKGIILTLFLLIFSVFVIFLFLSPLNFIADNFSLNFMVIKRVKCSNLV